MPPTGDEGGALNAAARAVETRRADALAVVITLTSTAARAKRSASSVAMLTVVPLAARASSRRITRAVAVVAHCRSVAVHITRRPVHVRAAVVAVSPFEVVLAGTLTSLGAVAVPGTRRRRSA